MSCEKVTSNCILQLNMNVNISWWIENGKINYIINSAPRFCIGDEQVHSTDILTPDRITEISLDKNTQNELSNRYDKYTLNDVCNTVVETNTVVTLESNKNNSNINNKEIDKKIYMKCEETMKEKTPANRHDKVDNLNTSDGQSGIDSLETQFIPVENDAHDNEFDLGNGIEESNDESTGELIEGALSDSDKNSYVVTPMYVRTLFPYSKDIIYENLKMTEIGLYSISNRHDSGTLTRILNQCILSWNMKANAMIITDGTAGIGGNSIAFGMTFKKVNAVEIDEMQYNALVNNVDVYKLNNVNCHFGNCLKIIPLLDQHIIFLDPPWGGKLYKKVKKLDLFLSGIPLVFIVNLWKKKCKNLEMVALKIPKNFSLENFAKECEYPFLYLLYFRKYNVLILSKRICKPIEHRHFQGYIKNRRNSI